MKRILILILGVLNAYIVHSQDNESTEYTLYLDSVKKELNAVWPNNRTINIVFHGHSVPAGYWSNHEVHTLNSYPYLLLKKIKSKYPYAVVNIITTAIGGEGSIKGEKRFTSDVLPHKPDVLLIDYALNDYNNDLAMVKKAWGNMIETALSNGIKVILLTPSPDTRLNILDSANKLSQLTTQIRDLAAKYKVGLADPYKKFQAIALKDKSLKEFMSHINHPNEKGHEIIAEEIFKWF